MRQRFTEPWTWPWLVARLDERSSWVRSVVLLSAIVGLPLLLFAMIRWATLSAEAASVLVAVVVALGAVVQNRRQERRRTTVELLSAFTTADELVVADRIVAQLVRDGRRLPVEPCEEVDAPLITVLDYYELLSRLALAGQLDPRLLGAIRGGAMSTLVTLSDGYIGARRRVYGPELYAGVEAFVATHISGEPRRSERPR